MSDSLTAMQRLHLCMAENPPLPKPSFRKLRVFTFDPSLGAELETYALNETTVEIPWEHDLKPGPVGEYLEVVDIDPASGCAYAPVDLNAPELLSQDGLRPSESDPRFHQQMVYAVAMRTIQVFERALGRAALWAPRFIRDAKGKVEREEYVQRLRIHPHALRIPNAYYSPERMALLFGYFPASTEAEATVPGGMVFACLSHDIVAHETSHALLDGLHRRYRENTNLDMLAFHEAFADIIALFLHFTVPDALGSQIASTGGDLGKPNLMAEMALQFGRATRGDGALRDYIGEKPTRNDYAAAAEPHNRGAVLVAAVFDAFLRIYQLRTRDLIRLATGGTGVLPAGAIPHDLVQRLSQEAGKLAGHWLNMCIRALDYCPPVDLTFGDYLRALVTADRDLVPEDRLGYRVAIVAAFRDRGIYAEGVRTLSEVSVAWEPPPDPLASLKKHLQGMDLFQNGVSDRRLAYQHSREHAEELHTRLFGPDGLSDDEMDILGLHRRPDKARNGKPFKVKTDGGTFWARGIEVHSVRPARRVSPDGLIQSDIIVEMTQSWSPDADFKTKFRGGCTLLIDADTGRVRYLIRKRVGRTAVAAPETSEALGFTDPRDSYFRNEGPRREPFALLHGH
ncbi:hypothetical protein [Azospirillum sp. TSO22-1]|uniref:hypothetical protein n=1 Tax=Azospirillum sp. TSO22-1 TaxID=716789 RepID=UPI000D655EF6|nr:hypothetical protein [Azospirillum sp. TSO22-1]